VFGCDANLGILKRDIELVRLLAKAKSAHGYPRTFRVCSTKNSNDVVFDIENILHEAGMSKGVSLSMQSLSLKALENIRRVNIKIDTFHDLQARYIKAGLTTYTEMILALPGETYETFRNGINTLLANGQHSQLHIYSCTVLVNSELGAPGYMKKHGIRTVQIPIFQAHSTPDHSPHHVVEYENIVVETNTMPLKDWLRSWRFSWAVLCFHSLGIFQMLAIFLYGRYKISYGKFYEYLVDFAEKNPRTLLGRELRKFNGVLDNVLAGKGFSQTIPEFGDISWPPEEASFLRLSKNRTALYKEAAVFLKSFLSENGLALEEELIEDLLRYQKVRLVHYTDGHHPDNKFKVSLKYNLPEYVSGVVKGEPPKIRRKSKEYCVVRDHNFAGNKEKFAREVVWYGRKGGRYLYAVKC
jgi:putative methyltransferase